MADYHPELQARLDELEHELEVRVVARCAAAAELTLAARRRETLRRRGKPVDAAPDAPSTRPRPR